MTVRPHETVIEGGGEVTTGREGVKMKNNWVTATFAVVIWLIISVMNVANLVLLGQGK